MSSGSLSTWLFPLLQALMSAVPAVLGLAGCVILWTRLRTPPTLVMLVGQALALCTWVAWRAYLQFALLQDGSTGPHVPTVVAVMGAVEALWSLLFAGGLCWLAATVPAPERRD